MTYSEVDANLVKRVRDILITGRHIGMENRIERKELVIKACGYWSNRNDRAVRAALAAVTPALNTGTLLMMMFKSFVRLAEYPAPGQKPQEMQISCGKSFGKGIHMSTNNHYRIDPRQYYLDLCKKVTDDLCRSMLRYMLHRGYIGEKNRVTRAELAVALLGSANPRTDRKIRKAKEELTKKGFPFLSSSGAMGMILIKAITWPNTRTRLTDTSRKTTTASPAFSNRTTPPGKSSFPTCRPNTSVRHIYGRETNEH